MKGYFEVLIVDDEPVIIATVGAMLRQSQGISYKCESVHTIEAAKAMLKAHEFDLVILDLHLPGHALGFDGLKEIVIAAPRVAVIILTGNTDPDDAYKAIELGAQDYITKPMTDIEKFLTRVRNAIIRHNNHKQSLDRVDELERAITAKLGKRNWKLKLALITGAIGIIGSILALVERIVDLIRHR